jgi:hypothetical protein
VNRIAIAVVSVSHSEWFASSGFDTMTVAGSVTGAWTKLTMSSTTDIGTWIGQPSGTIQLFYKLSPTVGAETVTVTFADTTVTEVAATISVEQYSGVNQSTPFGTPVCADQNAPITITVPSNTDDFTIFGVGYRSAGGQLVAGDYNRTVVYLSPTAATSGMLNYTLHGRYPGASTVAHTVTRGGTLAAGFGVNLRKA